VKSIARESAVAVLASVPWCCVVPAALSLLSFTGMAVARLWLAKISWFFLPLAVLLLGRAFWLHYAKRQGAPWTRWVTWTATLVSVGLWLPRVWMILSL
jgi:hypothetical protein